MKGILFNLHETEGKIFKIIRRSFLAVPCVLVTFLIAAWLHMLENFPIHNTAVLFLITFFFKDNKLMMINENILMMIRLPFRFYICNCSYIIFGCQYKFIVNNPFRFMIKTSRRMQLNNLIVFYGQIVASSF